MAEWSKAVRSGRILRAWVRIPLMSQAGGGSASFFISARNNVFRAKVGLAYGR